MLTVTQVDSKKKLGARGINVGSEAQTCQLQLCIKTRQADRQEVAGSIKTVNKF